MNSPSKLRGTLPLLKSFTMSHAYNDGSPLSRKLRPSVHIAGSNPIPQFSLSSQIIDNLSLYSKPSNLTLAFHSFCNSFAILSLKGHSTDDTQHLLSDTSVGKTVNRNSVESPRWAPKKETDRAMIHAMKRCLSLEQNRVCTQLDISVFSEE